MYAGFLTLGIQDANGMRRGETNALGAQECIDEYNAMLVIACRKLVRRESDSVKNDDE
jgi:hypothetical protein